MKVRGTLAVVGRIGPLEVLTDEVVKSIDEKIGKTIALRGPETGGVLMAEVTHHELVALADGTAAISLDVEIDDALAFKLGIAGPQVPAPTVPATEATDVERGMSREELEALDAAEAEAIADGRPPVDMGIQP